MDDLTIARVIHVVAVTMWIGGVAFVTTVVMPAIRRLHPAGQRLSAFELFEGAFANQARFWVLLAGGSGGWMVWRGDMWWRFIDPSFWWMDAMALLWLAFAVMLFIVEPLFLHRRMSHSAAPAILFDRMELAHRLALGLAMVVVAGAVAGSHGLI